MAERTRTRLSPDQRREEILREATEIFRETPYSEVSLDAIAERAGVTRGLLHHYFGSKRALYLAVLEQAVRIPASARIVPPGVSGTRDEVIALCVTAWMQLIERTGGLWAGVASSGGFAEADVDAVFSAARDDLVERMLEEFPFPPELDRDCLRTALKAFSGYARVATDQWLMHSTTRAATHAMLTSGLIALIEQVVPAMEAAMAADEPGE